MQALLNRISNPSSSLLFKTQNKAQQQQRRARYNQFYRKYDKDNISHYIPCLHILYQQGASKTLIYFHANAEDIILSHELLENIKTFLKVHVIAVEYPGYGIY